MKLIIDIPEKTIAHIRSNYGHGYKGLYDEDRDIIATAIYTGKPYENIHGEWTKIQSGDTDFPESKDLRRRCYVICIPREEMKEIVVQAYDEEPSNIDECMSLVLAKKILQLINSDRREIL